MNARGKLPVETPDEWLKFAEENLSVARREAREEHAAHHTICFLCHAAAEKYLKAYLISKGWSLKKTHDLLELIGLCSEYEASFQSLSEAGSVLNEYSVTGRYPGDISFEIIGANEAQEAIHAALRLRDFVSQRMPSRKP